MRYLFNGRLALKLNSTYQKLGLKAFLVNFDYLSDDKLKELNRLYFNGYLLSLVYVVYQHLFKLNMSKTGRVSHWYNSVQAVNYIKIYRYLMASGINPVQFMSSRFSSFLYDQDKYHQVYDYHLKSLINRHNVIKSFNDLSKNGTNFYYFRGNPVLDVCYEIFQNEFITEAPLVELARMASLKWHLYLRSAHRVLRLRPLDFKVQFKHSRNETEKHLCFSQDDRALFVLLGVPDDSICFGFYSDELWHFTNGYRKNLIGFEDYFRGRLAIPDYRLYGVNVARDLLKVSQYLWS